MSEMTVASKKNKGKKSLLYIWENRWLYLFVIPAFLTVLIFNYFPLPGIIMAFQNFDPMKGFFHSTFVGLDNFRSIFESTDLPRVIKNTLGISALGFCLGFPLPIILAVFINEMSSIKLKKFIQTTSYLPHFISWIVVSGIMYEILDINTGAVNKLIGIFGGSSVDFLADPKLFWIVSVLIAIWKEIGWGSIIYLAAIVSIDQEQYEAAIVDGASRLKRILHITIPGIMPTVAVLLILQAGSLLSGAGLSPGFDGTYNLGNPGNADASEVLDIWIFREGIRRMNYSFASSVGLVLSVINMTFVFIANKIANKVNDSGIF